MTWPDPSSYITPRRARIIRGELEAERRDAARAGELIETPAQRLELERGRRIPTAVLRGNDGVTVTPAGAARGSTPAGDSRLCQRDGCPRGAVPPCYLPLTLCREATT
jgi:hypothetical protein